MAENKVIGKVVTKATFDVDKKGLANLKKFRKKIEELGDIGKSPVRAQTKHIKEKVKRQTDAHIMAYKANARKVAKEQAKIDEQIAIKTKRAETSMAGVKFAGRFGGDFSRDIQNLARQLKAGQISMAAYRAEMDATVKKYKVMSRSTRTVSQDLAKMRRMVVNLTAAYGAFTAVQSVAQTGFSFEQTESMLQGVLGDADKAAMEMQFLRGVSRQFGSDLQATAKGYATLSSAVSETNLGQQDARDLFNATSKAAAGFGLSADEASGIMKSLVQTINKGQPMAEEIKSQLTY